jgi:hypothetical protein
MRRFLSLCSALMLALAVPAIAAAQLLDVSTDWKGKSGLPTYCPDAIERRLVVQGPGRLKLVIDLRPYRSAGKMAYVPVTWATFRPDGAVADGWGDTPFAGHLYTRWTSLGREVRNFTDGAPLQMERVWQLDARKYVVGVRLGAPCQAFGGSGFAQYAQAQHLVLSFEGTSAPTPPVATPQTTRLFDNGNPGGVSNGPAAPTLIRLDAPTFVARITDYHWNGGRGAAAGTIALRDTGGRLFGPWPARLQGPAYWVATPGAVLPAGTYTVIDSAPSTWSWNAASGGSGMTWLEGYPAR